MADANTIQAVLELVQQQVETKGLVAMIWNGELSFTFYLQDGNVSNREVNW
ncbi:MAG: hypothetical protein H0U60_18520, partial [Blastocatellia bacterium]|nr:hypothetical protein [Blastocatellia bacterium]